MVQLSPQAQKMIQHYWGSLEEAAAFMKHERRRHGYRGHEYVLSGWKNGLWYPTEIRMEGERIYGDELIKEYLPGRGIAVIAEIIATLLTLNLISWTDCKFDGHSKPTLAERKEINTALRKVKWSGPFLSEEKMSVQFAKRKAARKIEKLNAEKIRILERLKIIDELLKQEFSSDA